MRKAMIQDGVVVNVIVADDDFSIEGFDLVDISDDTMVEPGYKVEVVEGEYVFKKPDYMPKMTLEEYLLNIEYRISLIELGLI